MSHHRYHPQGKHQHEPGQGSAPKLDPPCNWLQLWQISEMRARVRKSHPGYLWSWVDSDPMCSWCREGTVRTQRAKTKNKSESGGERGWITICLWLGASGKGMQKQGMEGLCARKGTLVGTDENCCNMLRGIWTQISQPEMENGTSCMETGLGNEESQGAIWKGRMVAGAEEIQSVSRWKANKECTPTCAPPCPQALGHHSEIQILLILAPANWWKPLSCFFSFQQNFQERGASPTALHYSQRSWREDRAELRQRGQQVLVTPATWTARWAFCSPEFAFH